MLELEEKYPGKCCAMIGLHPCSVNADYLQELGHIEKLLQQRTFAGIGETGLDFYWDTTYKAEQYLALEKQIEWALQYKRPLILHTRNARQETIDVIKKYKCTGLRGIFHCFGGTKEEAEQIIDCGFLLGIGGVVTYKKSGLAEVLPGIDMKHMVLETEAPYLAPVAYRGKVLITGMCNPWWAKETKTGNIVCAGSCRNLSNNLDEGSIFLLDSLGNLKWERSFAQGNDHAYFRDIIETSDSGFICAGFCFEGTSGGQDAWLVKLDSLGCDSVGCATYTALHHTTTSNGTRQEVRLYPNPAKEIFYIKFPHAFFADTYTVTVTDMQGQILLYQKQVYNLRQDIPIFVNNIASGMYLVTIKAEERGSLRLRPDRRPGWPWAATPRETLSSFQALALTERR